ncbi:hypothetical protein GWO43_15675, partial [candidate division KSB1 bacterium]|nr:hypothetical protein [candidate division KSB1 bacterium]NIR68520.1 hypothetical protein [candidate division KSB1 bacterium]NIS25396.1 hypothetical protein [candidate division KSB1 bacterium]NIT72282.1 hypothetical protein [candidate division KSB1 bacterium]NIU89376.1 hypothetical protein [candidate division KSB1 bacterium]
MNSAVGNYDETKKKLDERKKNSAMPGKMQIPNQENNFEPQRSTTQSLIQNAAEHFKAQGRYPGAPAAAA